MIIQIYKYSYEYIFFEEKKSTPRKKNELEKKTDEGQLNHDEEGPEKRFICFINAYCIVDSQAVLSSYMAPPYHNELRPLGGS